MKKLLKKITKKDWIYLAIIVVLIAAIATITGMWLTGKPAVRTNKSYYEMKCYSFSVQNANLSKGQIVFIGDSITDLYPLDTYYTGLNRATYNRGIGGDVTQGVLDRLQVSVFDLAPSTVVLMIGINDLDGGRSNEYIASNYEKIVKEIRTKLPSTELLCMSVIPQHEKLEEYTWLRMENTIPQIKKLNVEIQRIAEENGAQYVDLFSAVKDDNDRLIKEYSDDGIHLNANGFAVWTETLLPYLAKE